jgi:hypothetical protein
MAYSTKLLQKRPRIERIGRFGADAFWKKYAQIRTISQIRGHLRMSHARSHYGRGSVALALALDGEIAAEAVMFQRRRASTWSGTTIAR